VTKERPHGGLESTLHGGDDERSIGVTLIHAEAIVPMGQAFFDEENPE
jgi:hypothetical protein